MPMTSRFGEPQIPLFLFYISPPLSKFQPLPFTAQPGCTILLTRASRCGARPSQTLIGRWRRTTTRRDGTDAGFIADSGSKPPRFRDDTAHYSGMISPGVVPLLADSGPPPLAVPKERLDASRENEGERTTYTYRQLLACDPKPHRKSWRAR